MKIPITQSREWAILQQDLGEKSFFVKEKTYQYLAILKSAKVGNYLFCPYGPVADTQAGFDAAIKSLKALAREQNAIFIRIEPQDAKLKLPKAARKSKDIEPAETWLLDLTGDDLKAKLPSRLLRYYRAAEKKGITIEKSKDPNDIHYLLDLQKALAKEKGINTFSEDYYKAQLRQPFATLYIVKHYMNVVAAGLVFDHGDTRYNLQGAQSDEGRGLHATGILTIELIKDAKAKNLKTFDFWGIAPEGSPKTHPWAGFTAFKKTFAGYEQKYHGTYDLVINPAKYRLYKLLRRFARTLHK